MHPAELDPTPDARHNLELRYADTLVALCQQRFRTLKQSEPEGLSVERIPYLLEQLTVEVEANRLHSGGAASEFVILEGASGSGKGTVGGLLEQAGIRRMPRYTDRYPRPGEEQGKEYFFVTPDEFSDKLSRGAFVGQPAATYGERRGIDREILEQYLSEGKFYLDGSARTPLDFLGDDKLSAHRFLSTFILAPSFQVLAERLQNRSVKERAASANLIVSSDEQVAIRLAESVQHLEKANRYVGERPVSDIFVVNDQAARVAQIVRELL